MEDDVGVLRRGREGGMFDLALPLRLALSAPLPGDFRPVIVSVMKRWSRVRELTRTRRASVWSTEGDPSRAPTVLRRRCVAAPAALRLLAPPSRGSYRMMEVAAGVLGKCFELLNRLVSALCLLVWRSEV